MQFTTMIDSVQYKAKPKNEAYAIKTRLATSCQTPQDCTTDRLKAAIESGCTFCPATIRPTLNDKGENSHQAAGFVQQQVFGIDIDNDYKSKETGKKERLPDGDYLPHGKALEVCEALEIKPFMLYHSFSSTAEVEKYRLLVCLDEPITDDIERERIQKAFVSLFGNAADRSCTNADRIFFGSTPGSVFYTDNDAITPKSVFLNIAKAQEECEKAERAEKTAVQRAMKKAGSQAAYEAAKDSKYDATPEELLTLIPVSDPNRAEWVKITAAYKNSSGDRLTWDTWNSGYHDDNEKHDAKTWETCGKAGKNGACGIGTLKYYAKQFNLDGYKNYIDDLTAQQRAARQGSAGKTAQKKQTAALIENSSGDQSDSGTHILRFSDGSSVTVPVWVIPNKSGNFVLSPSLMEETIRSKHKFIYTRDNNISGKACYAYFPDKGRYIFQDEASLMGMCKRMVDDYNRNADKAHRLDGYTKKLKEVVELLLTLDEAATLRPDQMDAHEGKINCESGMIDMKTGETLPHSPKWCSTIQLPVKYNPQKQYSLDDAPTFAKYLDDLTAGDPDRKRLLLEYAGAAFSNVDGSRYKRILYLVGAGDSGKSQYVRLISAIIGELFSAPTKFNMLDKQFQSAVLVGKRFVYDPDYDTGEVCGNNVIMCATGGDMLSIERKGKDAFSYRFRGLLCVCSNEMPRTRGNLHQAFYNRLLVCQCPNPVPKEKQDKHILAKMLKEREAIVGVCLAAFLETIRNGRNYSFTIPQDNAAFIKELKAENDPISEFLQDWCKLYDPRTCNSDEEFERGAFYIVFKDWYKKYFPHRPIASAREFYKKICAFYCLDRDYRQSHGARYCFVTLTTDARNELRPGSEGVAMIDLDSTDY